jgi:hypothetical protein
VDDDETAPMGCFVVLFALISPRLALFLTWVFNDRLSVAFDTWLWPMLGFFLLPWTTLVWTYAYAPVRGVSGLGWVFVIIALLADLGVIGSAGRERRDRDRRA